MREGKCGHGCAVAAIRYFRIVRSCSDTHCSFARFAGSSVVRKENYNAICTSIECLSRMGLKTMREGSERLQFSSKISNVTNAVVAFRGGLTRSVTLDVGCTYI